MLDDEQIAQNRFKRPHYQVGNRVRTVAAGSPFDGWQGEVTSLRPLQNNAGYVVTYLYRLRMENYGIQEWPEESLTPVIE